MRIRKSSIRDLADYTKMFQKTYTDAYVDDTLGLTKDCFSEEIFNMERVQEYLKSNLISTETKRTWLAFDKDKLVGSITCKILNENEAEITGFYVLTEYQGKGIGKKLYKKALKYAGKRDKILDVYLHAGGTIEMYKKWGWVLDESRGDRGYFERHWKEWPEHLSAKEMYMRLPYK